MRRIFVLFSIVLSVFCSSFSHAGGIFTITDVEISGDGANAREAKNNAFKDAEAKAFQKLLKRITPSHTEHLWPQLEGEKISELVQVVDLQAEKITSSHYFATVDISFNQSFVEKVLQDAGVSYTATQSKRTLILPMLVTEGHGVIWGDANIWGKAWKRPIRKSSFANFILPEGDAKDVGLVNIDRIMQGEYPIEYEDGEKLKALTNKYKAEKLLLAKAFPSEYQGTLALEVDLVYLTENQINKTTRTFYEKTGDDALEKVMATAVESIISSAENKWKEMQENLRQSNAEVNLNIPISSLSEWNETYKKISGFDFIEQVDTRYVTVEFASLDLHFQNGYAELVKNLADNGLYIERRSNGLFIRKNEVTPGWFTPMSNEIEAGVGEVDYEHQR